MRDESKSVSDEDSDYAPAATLDRTVECGQTRGIVTRGCGRGRGGGRARQPVEPLVLSTLDGKAMNMLNLRECMLSKIRLDQPNCFRRMPFDLFS